MFDPQNSIKQQHTISLDKVHEALVSLTLIIPGPFLRIFNHHIIVLDPPEIIHQIQKLVINLQQSEKEYVKDSVALGWFIDVAIRILHLASKNKSFVQRMFLYMNRVFEFRKVKSLYNQKIKQVIVIKAFSDLCFLQMFIYKKQYIQLETQVFKLISYYQKIDQNILKIPLSHLQSLKVIVSELTLKKITDKQIIRAVEFRKTVIKQLKQYYDRTVLSFYILDTMTIAMKVFQQLKSDICTSNSKGNFIKKLFEEICTKNIFGDTALKSLKNKYLKIVANQIEVISNKFTEDMFKKEQRDKENRGRKSNHVKNYNCNSFLYEAPRETTFHKQSHRSLHRYNCDQRSVLRYLLCSQDKKKIVKTPKFDYNSIKQIVEVKPVKNQELSVQTLTSELSQIVRSESYTKKHILSFNSFKARKNNSMLARRLKRISVVLEEQNLSDCSFASPLKFSKHLNKQVSSVQVSFLVGKDSGSLQLIIRQPNNYCQLSLFSIQKLPTINTGVLINRYKQNLQSSIYYYEFFDGVRDEIESTDVVDMMLSELILEYEGRIERKLLTDYMLIKQYISKYFYWKHLRSVNKISGFTFKLIPIPQILDFLKFSLYLENIIRLDDIPIVTNSLSISKMKKSMYPILQYLSDSKIIILKNVKNIGPSYYMDVLVSHKNNINNMHLTQGQVDIQNVQYNIQTYSMKSLSLQVNTRKLELQLSEKKQIIKRLIFDDYLDKCTVKRLIQKVYQQGDQNRVNKRQKLPTQYRRSLVEEETICLIDQDLKFDQKSTPKMTEGISTLVSNGCNQLSTITSLLTLILKQSLKKVKVIESKIQYETIKYYQSKGYYRVRIREEIKKYRPIIKFQLIKSNQTTSLIFIIQKSYLIQIFPKLNYQQIINQILICKNKQHSKLVLTHNNTHIESKKRIKNNTLFIYRRRICSKIFKSNSHYYVLTIYYNIVAENWEVEIFDQKSLVMKCGSINVFELGMICLSKQLQKLNMIKRGWLSYLINPSSFLQKQQSRLWLTLLSHLNIQLFSQHIQILQTIIYLQLHIKTTEYTKRVIKIDLDLQPNLQHSTFSVYGYQQYQHSLTFYSSITYSRAKQLYMLDYYYSPMTHRQTLNKLGQYICNKINNNQYDEEIYVFSKKEYLSCNVEVMDKINCQRNLKIASKRRSGIYFDLERELISFIHESTIEQDCQKVELDGITVKYWKFGGDGNNQKVLVWMEYRVHYAAIVLDVDGLERILQEGFRELLKNLLVLC